MSDNRFNAAFALALFMVSMSAHGVPSFARQTGLECVTCHLSWPELTSVGRQFKLGGYTLIKKVEGERPWLPNLASAIVGEPEGDKAPAPRLPLAVMVQASATNTRSTANADPDNFARNNDFVLQQLSAFYAGRIAERFGAFAQWTYDGVAHHSAIDNVDVRFANHYEGGGMDVSYGLTLNNNPTVSDIYNTSPAWGFPFASSSVAVTPNAAPLIDGGLAQQVAGLGIYAMWNKTLYTEVAAYRTADGAFSLFRAGTDKSTDAVLDGSAPYWRVALQHVWDEDRQSAMIGTYGIMARKFPDSLNPTGPSDRYRDVGVDVQYQYVTDRHRFSTQFNWMRERQDLDGSFAAGDADNQSDRLTSFKAKATYYYDRRYGATLAYFRTRGTADDALYNTRAAVTGSASGSPDTSGYIVELDWLPRRNIRLALQYTGYTRFNGASGNYDGFGRNARDNNTLYFTAWLMF
jgi:hypothetical protein